MAYTVMTCICMVALAMALTVRFHIALTYTVIARIVLACVTMVCIDAGDGARSVLSFGPKT